MSSTDASDLVDSDDAEVSSPPTKSSRSRFLERSAGTSRSRKKTRPKGDNDARAKKRSRLERCGDSTSGEESRGRKGKGKAASCSKAAAAASCAPAGSRQGVRKDNVQEEERSSSSWHGSSTDGSGSSDEGGGGGGGRRGQSAYGRKDTRKTPRVATSRRATAKSGQRLDNTRSGARMKAIARRQRPPNSSSFKAPPPRKKSAVAKGPERADSDSSYTGCDDAEDSEEGDQEFELEEDVPAAGARGLAKRRAGKAARRRTLAASRNTGGAADGTATRSGSRKRPIRKSAAACFPQLLELPSDDDDGDDQNFSSGAVVKPPKKHAGSASGGRQGGGGGDATSTLTPFALSDDDDDDCLRNTDSDDDGAAGGRGGGDGGGDDVSSNSSDEPVLCRCGARDWRDGTRWIRCDVPGCRTWEHLACAYPGEGQGGSGGEEGRKDKAHVCGGCQAKGSSTKAAGAARGGRRSLTRWGDDEPTAPSSAHSSTSLSPPVGENTPSGSQRSGGAGSPSVRRSQRVSRLEGMRVRLRKNVVGDEESPSSSDDDPSSPHVGVARSGGGGDGGGIDHAEEGSGSESDGFWAPEGQVEISQEYRCRCGATRGDNGGGGGGADGGASGEWVRCHSHACGLWEHAACCDYGCSAPSRNPTTRRHFCLDCDPKGKKHARWEDKMQKRELAARGAVAAGRVATATASSGVTTVAGTKKTEEEERFGAMVRGLWMAVVSGNSLLVEKAFREAEGSDVPVRRLVSADPPEACPDVVSLLAGGRARDDEAREETAKDDDKVIEIEAPSSSYPLPAGLSLLMVAAGYWKVIVDEAAATLDMSAAAAATVLPEPSCSGTNSNTPPCTEDRPEETAAAADVGSSTNPLPGSPRLPLDVDGPPGMVGSEEQEVVAAESKTPVCGTATAAADQVIAACPGPVATSGAPHAPTQTPTAGSTITAAAPTAVAASRANFPQLASDARLAVLRLVLERSRERAVLAVDAEGRTALHHAAAVGGAGEASLLLGGELGRRAALMMSHERLTPLHVAAAAGHPETCVSILRALAPGPRAAVLEASDAGASDETALHLACLEGRSACVRAILEEDSRVERELADEMTSHVVNGVPADTPPTHAPVVLARTAEGATALMAAAGCPSPSCVELIIGNLRRRIIPHPGSKLSELRAVDQLGMNALHYAAGRDAEGSVSAAKAVLAAERSIACDLSPGWGEAANINGGDANNHASPLHLAAAISHKEMV
ncbi:unnamed protein product, partial [Ectocarpus fasciculatus]